MHNDLLSFIVGFRQWLDWAPAPLASAIVLLVIALLAWLLSLLITDLLLRFPGRRGAFFRLFVKGMRRPVRGFIVIVAVGSTLPAAGLPYAWFLGIAQALLVALVLLVGWGAGISIRILSDGYLSRFKTGEEDNLLARKHMTQIGILRRAADLLIFVITISTALMTFEPVRQYGLSLFASAGAASLIVGLAARPLLTNLIAGVQIAITQPIRIEDAIIVENEWGWVEEITSTYVVVRLWDWRRLVLPLTYFIQKPFQNWTREGASLIGSVLLYVDHTAPLEAMRAKLREIAGQSRLWDRNVVNLQVPDARETVIEVRMLVSARNAPQAWDLRCEVREKMINFLQAEYPGALPRHRAEWINPDSSARRPADERPRRAA